MKCVLVALVSLSGLSFHCLAEESKNTAVIGSISTGEALGGRGRVVKPEPKYDVRWSKVSHRQGRKVTISEVTPPLLKLAHQARIRTSKLRQKLDRQRRDNPPPKPDLTVYFWKRDVEDEKRQRLQAKGVSQ